MEKCAPDYKISREEFSYVGVEYVVSGRARVTIGGRSFDLRPGSLFGYTPNSDLTIENRGVYPLTKYFVDVHGSEALNLFKNSPLGKLQVLEFAGVRWVEETFRQMLKFGTRGGPKAQRSCDLLAELLLLQVEESEHENEGGASTAYLNYRKCKETIEKGYVRINSIADVAATVNLDQAYIARLFKRFDSEAPYKQLVRLKMNHAARLLFRENMLVKNAAEAVGFEDSAHFSRVFKNTYGVAPTNFSKTVWG